LTWPMADLEMDDAVEQVAAATERFLATVSGLSPFELDRPTLLPGWSRAHLLSHVARNADATRALLLGVRSGQPAQMYASMAVREADIEFGSRRPGEVILADAALSSQRFVMDARATGAMLSGSFSLVGRDGSIEERPASLPVNRRLQEVEFHHVDLDSGYTFNETPPGLLDAMLSMVIWELSWQDFEVDELGDERGDERGGERGDDRRGRWSVGGVEIAGPPAALLTWLSGRSRGIGLDATGPLPEVPSLG
jgi:maleylpyruvate isomerase